MVSSLARDSLTAASTSPLTISTRLARLSSVSTRSRRQGGSPLWHAYGATDLWTPISLQVQERLKLMVKAYVDLLIPGEEYKRQKRLLEMELESLVVSSPNAAAEAGRLVTRLPELWAAANEEDAGTCC